MQPLERKQTKIQSGVARARVLLKRDAPWLPGYPSGINRNDGSESWRVRWNSATEFTVDGSSDWGIDREGLRRAQMTFTKLLHRFPRALPKIVIDVDDWRARTNLLLELLKDAVHNGHPLSSDDVIQSGVLPTRWTDEVTRIKSTHGSLGPLLDALTFATLSDLQPCQDEPIDWIRKHAEPLVQFSKLKAENACDLPMLLLGCRDAISGPFLQSIARCLTDSAIQDCCWEGMDRVLNHLGDALRKAIDQNEFSMPAPTKDERLEALVRRALYRAVSLRPNRRTEVLGLLEQLLNPALLDSIAETQRQVASGERRLRRLLRRIESGHESIPRTKKERKAWLQDAKADQQIDPTQTATAKALGKTLRGIFDDQDANEETWTQFLASFPAQHRAIAVRLMARWRYDGYGWKHQKRDFMRVMEPLALLLHRRGVAAPLLQNWTDYVGDKKTNYEFVSDTCYEVDGKSRLAKKAVTLLEKTVYDLQLDLGPELTASLVEFAQATTDNGLSVSIVKQLSNKPDDTYDDSAIRIAISFGESPGEMADILSSLHEIGDLDALEKELGGLAGDSALRRIIAKRIIEGDVASLKRLTATISILNDLDRPLPEREAVSQSLEWISRYPAEFGAALRSLNESSPDAEEIADRVLGKAFPTREALQKQIDALQIKIDQAATGIGQADESRATGLVASSTTSFDIPRMQRRLANLKKRLAHPSAVSPKRRHDLIEKLVRRADEERLQRFTRQCREQVAEVIRARLGVSEFPDDLLAPPLDRVLREINRLSKPMRKLGIRLLLESRSRTTRSFDDEPKNLAFAQRIESSGINLGPWLSDQIRHSATTSDGTPYELAFTRDAIDFLLMGFHFDTCLSPDSFNFFSTVANAVDLNKRVVYGKTEAGKVIGRCLFALNESGQILTYHRYSHDPKDGFADAVDEFARRLADEMQTCIGNGGRVTKLVASDWYDDGPIGANLEWLGEGGLAVELADRVEPHQLLPELIDAVGENVVRQRVVEVATHAKLRDLAEFLSVLLDRFNREMTFRQRFTVAVNVGPIDVRNRLLSQMRWSDIVRFVHRNQCDQCDVFHGIAEFGRVFGALTQHHPSLGLRAIRAARPSFIQDDLQDPNRTRRKALIEAHKQLGRLSLAEQLSNK